MKQRNYAIEFLRILLAINFCVIHVTTIVPPSFLKSPPRWPFTFDLILVFMAISGYFLMQHFKGLQAKGLAQGNAASQAWGYLKGRLLGLLPMFLLAQFAGFVVLYLFKGLPLSQWPIAFLNHLGEFFGLQLSGFGMGNIVDGAWGAAAPTMVLLNTPMWFISGLFLCGYLVYFLLAKCEKLFLGLIAPLTTILFWASCYQADGPGLGVVMSPSAELIPYAGANPIWNYFIHIGDLVVNAGIINMFIGLSIGCLLWVAVDRLKGKMWSKGMTVFFTVLMALCTFFILYRAWVPTTVSGYLFAKLDWGPVYLVSIVFVFLIMLNADWVTKALNRKIFKVPGRLSLYIYMFHFPTIVACILVMGVETAKNTPLLIATVILASLAVSVLMMLLDTKVIQPWLKNKPWYSKEQKALEKQGQ